MMSYQYKRRHPPFKINGDKDLNNLSIYPYAILLSKFGPGPICIFSYLTTNWRIISRKLLKYKEENTQAASLFKQLVTRMSLTFTTFFFHCLSQAFSSLSQKFSKSVFWPGEATQTFTPDVSESGFDVISIIWFGTTKSRLPRKCTGFQTRFSLASWNGYQPYFPLVIRINYSSQQQPPVLLVAPVAFKSLTSQVAASSSIQWIGTVSPGRSLLSLWSVATKPPELKVVEGEAKMLRMGFQTLSFTEPFLTPWFPEPCILAPGETATRHWTLIPSRTAFWKTAPVLPAMVSIPLIHWESCFWVMR